MRMSKLLSTAAIATGALALFQSPAFAQSSSDDDDTSKELRPFTSWQDIDAFRSWGDIDPFRSWGDIEAFRSWGDIEAFREWRDIEAFRSWGDIEAFGQALDQFWGDIEGDWITLAAMDEEEGMQAALQSIFNQSKAFWGEAITEQTGLTFEEAFANEILAKYGIDLNDDVSFNDLDIADIVMFHFEWHDGLMSYTGTDHVDWWMPMVNWNPRLTEIQGGGNTVIGLVDFTVANDADLLDNLNTGWSSDWTGNDNADQGHGNAVISLMVADHDGQGAMGIAPQATVATYNPFGDDGTATWDEVRNGINAVSLSGARVVNLSLGVSGSTFDQGWKDVYDRWDVKLLTHNTVFVHAAGNDGVAQTENIDWGFSYQPELIIVGSVGVDGAISTFSNTPGNACFLGSDGQCDTYLKDRFIVAPGEMILVSDGHGGVTRANGTSFAAPIVSGAIALMHDRWSWLRQHPEETADIIFATAKDLGAPGVDEVYGHGLLDIEAAQSPIDLNNAYVYTMLDGEMVEVSFGDTVKKGDAIDIWTVEAGYFTVFEDIGDTYRDFLIPIDDQLVDTYGATDNGDQLFQSYLTTSFVDFASTTTTTTTTKDKDKLSGTPIVNPYNIDLRVSYAPLAFGERTENRLDYRAELMGVTQSGTAFRIGQGDGASRLGFSEGAATGSSNPVNGGANPILGFASGGAYGSISVPVSEGVRFSFGATERKVEQAYTDPMTGERMEIYEDLDTYLSRAVNMALTNDLTDRLSMSVSYTALNEANGMLGMQSLDPSGFGEGSMTDAATVGATFKAADDMLIAANATYGKTRSADKGAYLAADDVATSAFEVSVLKKGLFADNDAMRIALVQPMQVEDGALNATQYEVVDRSTGEIGLVENSFDLTSGERRLAVEARYGARFDEAGVEFSAFARVEGERGDSSFDDMQQMIGGRIAFDF